LIGIKLLMAVLSNSISYYYINYQINMTVMVNIHMGERL